MLPYLLGFYKDIEQYCKRIIHTRRLIISSDKKVIQFTISVPFQLCVIGLLACCLLWSSYATGRFIAAQYAIEAQNHTIRSVTAAKTNHLNMISSILPYSSLSKEQSENLNVFHDNRAKLAVLEQQVSELKNANEVIVERVRSKTDGQLNDLESILSQTGLDPKSIGKQINKDSKSKEDAEGGPFIPTDMPKISEDAAEMLESLDKLNTMRQLVANLPLGLPIDNAEEHSQFGHRIDPFNGNAAFHSGLDLIGPPAANIRSAADGIVVTAGREGAYGNMVDINHGFGIVTRYGHLSEIRVSKGIKVKKGDIIGVQGSTGRSTGPHLHYEVRYNGEAINPEKFIQTGKLLELGTGVSQN